MTSFAPPNGVRVAPEGAGGVYSNIDVGNSNQHCFNERHLCDPSSPCASCQVAMHYSVYQKQIKKEDVVFARERLTTVPDGPAWSLYCVCDGHTGVGAADFVKDNLWNSLAPLLPKCPLPEEGTKEMEKFASVVREAIVKAFVMLDKVYTAGTDISGAAVTAALVCGRLLTVANVGDSEAFLDIGTDVYEMTVTHRLEDSEQECERLRKAGMRVAALTRSLAGPAAPGEKGLGPLRCWPGGLALARSIGDVMAGKHVVGSPCVSQVILPKTGSRLVMASDGLWDLISMEDAAEVSRWAPIKQVASKLVTQAVFQNNWSFTDDTSVMVLDILPANQYDFPKLVKGKQKRRRLADRPSDKGLFSCFYGGKNLNSKANTDVQCDELEWIAQIDGVDLVCQLGQVCCDSFSSFTDDHNCVRQEHRRAREVSLTNLRRSLDDACQDIKTKYDVQRSLELERCRSLGSGGHPLERIQVECKWSNGGADDRKSQNIGSVARSEKHSQRYADPAEILRTTTDAFYMVESDEEMSGVNSGLAPSGEMPKLRFPRDDSANLYFDSI